MKEETLGFINFIKIDKITKESLDIILIQKYLEEKNIKFPKNYSLYVTIKLTDNFKLFITIKEENFSNKIKSVVNKFSGIQVFDDIDSKKKLNEKYLVIRDLVFKLGKKYFNNQNKHNYSIYGIRLRVNNTNFVDSHIFYHFSNYTSEIESKNFSNLFTGKIDEYLTDLTENEELNKNLLYSLHKELYGNRNSDLFNLAYKKLLREYIGKDFIEINYKKNQKLKLKIEYLISNPKYDNNKGNYAMISPLVTLLSEVEKKIDKKQETLSTIYIAEPTVCLIINPLILLLPKMTIDGTLAHEITHAQNILNFEYSSVNYNRGFWSRVEEEKADLSIKKNLPLVKDEYKDQNNRKKALKEYNNVLKSDRDKYTFGKISNFKRFINRKINPF